MLKQISLLLLFLVSVTAYAQDYRAQAADFDRKAETQVKKLEARSTRDSIVYFRWVTDVVNYSLKCDEMDRKPNQKGQVKMKFEKDNQQRLATYRPLLIDAGLYYAHDGLRDEGIAAWKLYLKTSLSPLLKDETDESGIAAYYIAQAELANHSYKAADRFADIAMKYDETAQQAAEVKAQCMSATMVNDEDSVKYLSVLTKLYQSDPTNPDYFAWIMQFYSQPSKKYTLDQFVDQQLEATPDSYVPWVLKGEIAMNAKRWEEAIEAYQQADQLKPDLVPVIYNIGVSMNNRVVEMQQTRTGTKAEAESLLAQARNYLERVRVKDPRQKLVKWASPLYMAYKLLGDKAHADELEPVVRGFK